MTNHMVERGTSEPAVPLGAFVKVLWISEAVAQGRHLVPAYRLKQSVLAWECDVCGKLFCISVAEAEYSPTQLPPPFLEREFGLHSCELQLNQDHSGDSELFDVEARLEARHEISPTAYGGILRRLTRG